MQRILGVAGAILPLALLALLLVAARHSATVPLGLLLGGAALAAAALLIPRSTRRSAFAALVLLAAGAEATRLSRPVSNAGEFCLEHRRLPAVRIAGDVVRIGGFRDFRHRPGSPPTPAYRDVELHLSRIRGLDFVVVPFEGSPGAAHTFLSFDFGEDGRVAVSVEARRRPHQTYTLLGGLFHEFPICYVIGDERDVVARRIDVDGDRVIVHPADVSAETARRLFLDVAGRARSLESRAEAYDTLTNNCTTALADHVNAVAPGTIDLDHRLVLPALSDSLALDHGLIVGGAPLEELRARRTVNERGKGRAEDPRYSEILREGLR